MHSFHPGRIAAVVVIVALALSGCAPVAAGDPADRTSSTSRPTGSSSAEPVRTSAPACDALATSQQAAALVGGSGELQRFEHLESGGPKSSWAALAANGAVCGWGENGLHDLVESSGTPWVFVRVVPGLTDVWNTLVGELSPSAGAKYDGGVSRGGSCDQICSTDVLVNGAWLSVEAKAATTHLDEAAFHAFVQGVVSRYRALPQPTPVAMHAPRSCEDGQVRKAVAEAFGSPGVIHPYPAVFSLAEALQRAGLYTSCAYFSGGDRDTWETWVTVVDHADPALLATYRSAVDHTGARSIDVSSLPAGSSALLEPTVDSQRTIVDTLSGSRWIDVTTYITSDSAASIGIASALTHSPWLG